MARQITLELLADSAKFESGMKDAARSAEAGAEKIEEAAKKADRMSGALTRTGEAADASESKFMGLSDVASGLGDLFGIEALGPIAATGLAMADLTGGFASLAPMMTGAIDNIKNLSLVTKAQTAVQTALNFVMSMNPIALVVIAIAALIAILVVAYKNSETFRDIVDGAFRVVKDTVMGVYNWVKDNWPLLLGILTGPIGLAVVAIGTHWDTIVGFVTGMPVRISTAAAGMWDGIKNAFKGAMNWIIDRWNGLEFGMPGFEAFGQKVGGFTVGMPDIPRLAAGGPATAGFPHLVGENGPELFVPSSSGTVVPNAGATMIVVQLDGRVLIKAVVDGLHREQRSSGVMTKLVA